MIRLENVLKTSLQDVLKTSWRWLEDVFQDVLKMFWRRLQNVLKMSWRRFCKKSWRRLENVLKTYGQNGYIGLDQDVLKTSSEDVKLRRTYSSWRRLLKTKTKDVFKTSSSRRMFAGTSLDSTFWVTWRKGMKTREAPDFFLLGWWRGYGKIWIARFL